MKENRTHHYELMCLLRQTAAGDLGAAVEHIREALSRHGGEIIALSKWDERRLAYEINKQKRGVYILSYVTLPTESLVSLERDLNLSETVLRWMILRADHLTVEEMQATDAQQALSEEIAVRAQRQRERDESKADDTAQPAAADA